MKLAVVIAIIATVSAFADYSEFGLHGGFYIPTGDAGDVYNLSPMLGGQFLMHMPLFAIEASASYVFLQPENDIDGFSAHMIPLNAGLRTYGGGLFYGGGLELDMFSVSWDTPAGEESESESDFGVYGTLGTVIPMGGKKLELAGKLHWINTDQDDQWWLSAMAGIYF
ncbi:MAG TPA: hypothetical protein PLX54_02215 [Candidatus Fermentibacter daniensis]|nr:hypothetical protein [Candidatus Fermentibacter daniensis]HOR06938.1 hypothetical protein [Candidatus Fermentibacter daniensis]HPK51167.1 hypothetical protein [Candidatus Fermentibacter daniensis]HQE56852.1 hypothetical protein [Candidatus Fermentibacter daniensis]HQH92023.1 hypothetical protein [Candidatus Fermentibacter daniensis]